MKIDTKIWVVTGGKGNLGMSMMRVRSKRDAFVFFGRNLLDLEWQVPDIQRALAMVNADGVVNAAAMTDVSQCELDPAQAFRVNSEGAWRVARAAQNLDIPMVNVSTDYVFGRGDAPYGVKDLPSPTNQYGASKSQGEWRVSQEGGINVRMSFLPDPPGYAWVADEILCTKEWVDDAARRLIAFCESRCYVSGATYHLTTPVQTTLKNLVHERYPDTPLRGISEVRSILPYDLPRDVRLDDSWES